MLRLSCHGPAPLGAVELSLPAGGRLCVVGGPGSGRSTLCRLAAGVLLPPSGNLSLDGEQYHLPEDGSAAPVGFLPFPAPDLTAAQSLDEVLARTLGVAHLLERPGPYSTGENQLLQLAGCLGRPHRYLVLDQPLAPLGGADRERALTALQRSPAGLLLTCAEPLDGWNVLSLTNGRLVP